MKKVLTMLLVASIFGLVACGTEGEEQTDAPEDTTPDIEQTGGEESSTPDEGDDTTEELAAQHAKGKACSDECTEEACHYPHGETGHTCGEGCGDDGESEGEGATDAG